MLRRPNVIDLFCGCGGFSLGFLRAGFAVKLGVDIWNDATRTFEHNIDGSVVLNKDITEISLTDISDVINNPSDDVDVIIGGPPCQGFSLSGKRTQEDPRNLLYKSFVRLVNLINPKIIVLENVPGLVRLYNGLALESIISDFTEIGYNIEHRILSADEYGVPQRRKRVFFVGINNQKIKNTKTFIFPVATNGVNQNNPYITCEDAISDLDFIPDDVNLGECVDYELPAITEYQQKMRLGSESILNHSVTLHKERTKEIISMVPDGGNYKSLPSELWSTRKVNIAWTRMNSKMPCFTIDTGHNHHFHYKANRVPTVRESARIQSFPDSFEFIGTKTSQLKQVGNAVPPLLAQSIAYCIMAVLKGEI